MTVNVEIDFDEAYLDLSSTERSEFIADHIDECETAEIIKYISKEVDLEDIIDGYSTLEIENWLEAHADEYGYTKEENE